LVGGVARCVVHAERGVWRGDIRVLNLEFLRVILAH
jgi:hypothetical protein